MLPDRFHMWADSGAPAAAHAASTEFDQLIKDSHDRVSNEVGLDIGTRVLRIARAR